jgi:hypothetical protein
MSADRSAGAVVCGFSDLASGVGGVGWNLPAPGGLLMSDLKVVAADAELSRADGIVTLGLRAGSEQVEATLAPRADPAELLGADGSDPPGGSLEAAACTATVRSEGGGRALECFGQLSRWAGVPLEGAGIFRHLAVEGADGSLLVLTARGGPGTVAHGDEQAAAWLIDEDGQASSFAEALLSTQYDDQGRHTRVGLELWPSADEEARPTRAAGTRIGGTEAPASGVAAALFRCSAEGAESLGSYLIWRG